MSKNQRSSPRPTTTMVDYKPIGQHTKTEVPLVFQPCFVCHKPITEGYYARINNSGTCNKSCWEKYKATRPYLIDYVIPTKE